jgi:hypothetical protein
MIIIIIIHISLLVVMNIKLKDGKMQLGELTGKYVMTVLLSCYGRFKYPYIASGGNERQAQGRQDAAWGAHM